MRAAKTGKIVSGEAGHFDERWLSAARGGVQQNLGSANGFNSAAPAAAGGGEYDECGTEEAGQSKRNWVIE